VLKGLAGPATLTTPIMRDGRPRCSEPYDVIVMDRMLPVASTDWHHRRPAQGRKQTPSDLERPDHVDERIRGLKARR